MRNLPPKEDIILHTINSQFQKNIQVNSNLFRKGSDHQKTILCKKKGKKEEAKAQEEGGTVSNTIVGFNENQ